MTEANGSRRELRSEAWFSGLNMFTFAHRSWNGRGYPPDVFDGRPVIGICNSWSELTTCNAHLRIVAEHVKRGVWEAGGLPLEFPTISLGESLMKPTTMIWRNLMSMDVEESLRANPLDGVVLLCGCDKTTPAQLMGAASVDLPTIVHARRADAERPVAGGGSRLGHRPLAHLRHAQARRDLRRGVPLDRGGLLALRRPLQHDGHRQHDDARWPRRSARR